MKKRELENQIKQALTSDAPDLRSKILTSCRNEAQDPAIAPEARAQNRSEAWQRFRPTMKGIVAAAICLVLFISGLSAGFLIPRGDNSGDGASVAETFVYLDVNPSIELQLNSENKVVDCIAANEDAKIILGNLQLAGTDMNTAVTAIIGSMYVNGYINETSNSILISVSATNKENESSLLYDLTNKVNSVFEKSSLECSIIAQGLNVDETLEQMARENGVSVGKMQLIYKMIDALDDFDDDDVAALASLSIKDLNLIFSTRPNKDYDDDDDDDPFDDDICIGNIAGFVSTSDAVEALLDAVDIDDDDVESCEVRTNIKQNGHSQTIIYILKVKLYGDPTIYEYSVNCTNGEIEDYDDRIPIRKHHDDSSVSGQGEHGGDSGGKHDDND